MADFEKAIKRTCQEYRKASALGKCVPLTVLRSIWRNAFLSGSRHVLESLGAKLPKKKAEES